MRKEKKNNFYVYRIDDPITKEFYIGSRGCNCVVLDDDYMGSMKSWKPDDKSRLLKTILKIGFNSMSDAIEYESGIIKENINHSLNRNYYIPNKGFHASGLKHSEKERKRKSESQKNRIFSDEHCKNLSIARRKYEFSDNHKESIRKSLTGYVQTEEHKRNTSLAKTNPSEETRRKMSIAKKGKSLPTHICPHCGKIGNGNAMKQWHFNNCKSKVL